ncbi:hypothetical protein MTR67_031919 [Solanum verrucosum]|uniref:Uncharacterized protein n=1 Tax=Solanum verrucosum TaxID=315347 RepID=A0AAF0U3F2_SOLVR|nr:hypothetical protein MTR67_031919 [Solanum verrucosum]
MQILRSCRCNPRLPSTDHRSDHGTCWWSVVHHCNPSPLPSLENRLSLDPQTNPRSVGQTTVRGSRHLYPTSDTNYGRPARTFVQCTIHRSDRG